VTGKYAKFKIFGFWELFVCQFQSVIDGFRGENYLPLFLCEGFFTVFKNSAQLYMTISFEHGVKSQLFVMFYQV